MKTAILGLLAETSIHPGTGRGRGVVDLPVAREAATDYPVLVGSSLKGALRDKFEAGRRGAGESQDAAREAAAGLFGTQNVAGSLMVSDARMLLLPVRSLTASYRWATCPHIIERYRRDLGRAGVEPRPSVPRVAPGRVFASTRDANLFLEERRFEVDGSPSRDLVKAVRPLIRHDDTRDRVESQLAVLHDDDFAWFARYGLSIQARNELEVETKRSVNQWYEETLPPDTVMYAVTAARSDDPLGALVGLFPDAGAYLQAGGNETVGQGWFAVTVLRNEREDS